jgi:hypothetical protein
MTEAKIHYHQSAQIDSTPLNRAYLDESGNL